MKNKASDIASFFYRYFSKGLVTKPLVPCEPSSHAHSIMPILRYFLTSTKSHFLRPTTINMIGNSIEEMKVDLKNEIAYGGLTITSSKQIFERDDHTKFFYANNHGCADELSFHVEILFSGVSLDIFSQIKQLSQRLNLEIVFHSKYHYINQHNDRFDRRGSSYGFPYLSVSEAELPKSVDTVLYIDKGVCKIQGSEKPFRETYLIEILDQYADCVNFARNAFMKEYKDQEIVIENDDN